MKEVTIKVLATDGMAVFGCMPFRDTTVGQKYAAWLLAPGEFDQEDYGTDRIVVSFVDDVGDITQACVASHAGKSFEFIQ